MGVARYPVARNHALLAAVLALVTVVAPATAVGVPTDASTQAAAETEEIAPGVYENGTVDGSALYDAHSEVLRDEGYQTSTNLSIVLNGTTFLTADTESDADAQNSSMTKNLSIVGLAYDIGVWTNESETLVRIVDTDGNVSYKSYERGPPADGEYGPPEDRGPDRGDGPGRSDRSERMNDSMDMMAMHHGMGAGDQRVPGQAVLLLEEIAGTFTVENETTMDDTTLYTLTAPVELDEDATGNFTGDVTLVVSERGVVHSADVTADSEVYDSESEYHFELDELGVDAVEQPDWVETVPEDAVAEE